VLLALLGEVASAGSMAGGPSSSARSGPHWRWAWPWRPQGTDENVCGVRRADPARSRRDPRCEASSRSSSCNKDYRGARRRRGRAAVRRGRAPRLGCSILALREKSNMQGLLDMGVNPAWLPAMSRQANEGAIADLEKDWCDRSPTISSRVHSIAELLRQKKTQGRSRARRKTRSGSENFPKDSWTALVRRRHVPRSGLLLPDRNGGAGQRGSSPCAATAETAVDLHELRAARPAAEPARSRRFAEWRPCQILRRDRRRDGVPLQDEVTRPLMR